MVVAVAPSNGAHFLLRCTAPISSTTKVPISSNMVAAMADPAWIRQWGSARGAGGADLAMGTGMGAGWRMRRWRLGRGAGGADPATGAGGVANLVMELRIRQWSYGSSLRRLWPVDGLGRATPGFFLLIIRGGPSTRLHGLHINCDL